MRYDPSRRNALFARPEGVLWLALLLMPLSALTVCLIFLGRAAAASAVPDWKALSRVAWIVSCACTVPAGALVYTVALRPLRAIRHILQAHLRLIRLKDGALYDSLVQKPTLEGVLEGLLEGQKEELTLRAKLEALRQETELYALQSQINPHFLYNTLDSIRGLALIRGVDEIAATAESLANFFHNVVARQGQQISLREELRNVLSYMEIQQFRFNNRFNYVCDIPPELQRRYTVPNLTLQPIVENSIAHGLEHKMGLGTIRVSGRVTDQLLVLSVADDGVGMSDQAMEQLNRRLSGRIGALDRSGARHTGIALSNINRRLKLQFGDAYGLYVMSTEQVGTTVEVTLPLCEAEQERARGDLYA